MREVRRGGDPDGHLNQVLEGFLHTGRDRDFTLWARTEGTSFEVHP